MLTLREIRYMDEGLPRLGLGTKHPKWLPDADGAKYAKVYRCFPAFSEVEG